MVCLLFLLKPLESLRRLHRSVLRFFMIAAMYLWLRTLSLLLYKAEIMKTPTHAVIRLKGTVQENNCAQSLLIVRSWDSDVKVSTDTC